MSLPSLDPYSAAFSHWTRVQKQLAQTIQDYVDAGAKLRSALGVYPKDYSSRRLRAEAFSGLNSQLPILASYEESLKEARFSLNIARNISHNLIPINSLPLEILSTIFITASWQERDAICSITRVCKLWRQTTLSCPSCWSRVELPIEPGSDRLAFERAKLWAERAKNEPLHVLVWERPNSVEDTWYTPYKTIEVVESLCPLMPRVRAIEFLDDILDLSDLVPATLASWAEHGTTGMAELLRLHAGEYNDLVSIRTGNIITIINTTLDEFKSFFSSLRTLSLRGAEIDCRLGLYSGLVDLRLGDVDVYQSYSQWDLASILAASPGLRSLALFRLRIGVHRREAAPNPVALNNLHSIQLDSFGESLWAALRLITSTSDSIKMSLAFEDHPEFIPAARSFFERCKVTALHISLPSLTSSPSMSFWFIPMPHFSAWLSKTAPP
ncbi:hypothetical protein FS749_016619 [Ceratobasidium sp. UAMH 11750]|nr:hypothetical protein FS749_016619 [Ceratobasidium sp. UAMH 11750]